MGLGLNGPKTKYLAYNVEVEQPLCTIDGTVLEQEDLSELKDLDLAIERTAPLVKTPKTETPE